eukprot:1780189-Lingulodinium_polyedra.AAC.1
MAFLAPQSGGPPQWASLIQKVFENQCGRRYASIGGVAVWLDTVAQHVSSRYAPVPLADEAGRIKLYRFPIAVRNASIFWQIRDAQDTPSCDCVFVM